MLHKSSKMKLSLMDATDDTQVCLIGRALSSPDRLRILRLLSERPMNMLEIATELALPTSSVANHVNALEEAHIISIQYQPAKKGHMKLCYKAVVDIDILYPDAALESAPEAISVDMPIGNYVDLCIRNSGYLANTERYLVEKNQIYSMLYIPERTSAQILGFSDGYVTYNFPNYFATNPVFDAIDVSFECCSEAPYYRNDWLSDITISVGGIEITTFTSPGDFGGRAGNYSPAYWPINATQYGLLYHLTVDPNGCRLNNRPVNTTVTIADLKALRTDHISLTLGIKEDARHRGGLNLFGKYFGDFPQDIVMKFYRR